MSRRIGMNASGLYIAPPGLDAFGGFDDNTLLFSPTRSHLMQVAAGSFILSSGVRVGFGIGVSTPPMVLCGVLYSQYVLYPVAVTVDTTGFNAYPVQAPDGSFPANGVAVTWAAFMRNQN